jgi:hypothetical protein
LVDNLPGAQPIRHLQLKWQDTVLLSIEAELPAGLPTARELLHWGAQDSWLALLTLKNLGDFQASRFQV